MSIVINIKIDAKGLSEMLAKMDKMAGKAAMSRAAREGGLLIQRNVIKKTPVKTGAARGSVQLKSSSAAGAIIAGSLGYLPGLEEGTRAHIIMPKNGKFLKFKGGSAGVVFARRVKHPGTKGFHMFRDGLMQSKSGVIEILKKHVAAAS